MKMEEIKKEILAVKCMNSWGKYIVDRALSKLYYGASEQPWVWPKLCSVVCRVDCAFECQWEL